MYLIGSNKDFSLSIMTEEDETLIGAYLAISNENLEGKILAKLSSRTVYEEVPYVSDNSWYIGSVAENETIDIDVRLNFEASDVNDFGNIYYSFYVVEGISDESFVDTTLFFGESAPDSFEGEDSRPAIWA